MRSTSHPLPRLSRGISKELFSVRQYRAEQFGYLAFFDLASPLLSWAGLQKQVPVTVVAGVARAS
jgi:hypothetical protein